MTQAAAREELWTLGVLAAWYLRDDQMPLYSLLRDKKRPFLECARRYGKTTSILTFVSEELLSHPGWVCMWCEPDQKQAREIIKPEVAKIFASAPRHLRPEWSATDSFYWWPCTGRTPDEASKLKLRGVNHDSGDSARGPFAHIIVADEFGTWKDPDYIVKEALSPQLQTTNGPFIFASTPPRDLGHLYYEHKEWAIREDRFIQRIIYDNKSLTPERIEELKAECGGENTPSWQREYLCKPVSDPESLVVPEFNESLHLVDDDYPRPMHFDPYVGVDLGFNDSTAILFGYWDFLKRELVIEDEYVVSGKNSQEITDNAKRIEKELWEGVSYCQCPACQWRLEKAHKPFKRVGDNDKQQLYDMHTMCGYLVTPTRKDDKEAAINALRLRFRQNSIKIHKRCKILPYQLKVGLWNDRRTDYLRGDKTGHLDCIDSLVYLNRNVNEHHNPFPPVVQSSETHFVSNLKPVSKDAEVLKSLLRPFGA